MSSSNKEFIAESYLTHPIIKKLIKLLFNNAYQSCTCKTLTIR